jgi:hypothetical protein
MLDKHLILGVFDNPDGVLSSVSKLRKKGYEIFDCYTPFPVHGLDTAMGIKRSNLTVGAFICGAIGFSLGLLLQFYIMVWDWPMIIGGKPDTYKMLPSMVPVTFEVTVLCTAFGMGLLFFARTKMIHGIKPDIIDPRQTDDRLFVAIEGKDGLNVGEISEIFKNEGALELRERNGDLLGSNNHTKDSKGNTDNND